METKKGCHRYFLSAHLTKHPAVPQSYNPRKQSLFCFLNSSKYLFILLLHLLLWDPIL